MASRAGSSRSWFRLPANWSVAQQIAPALEGPRASTAAPVLFERWRHTSGRYRLHLVNYNDHSVDVALHAGGPLTLHSPDPGTRWRDSSHQHRQLDGYAVIECD